MTPKGKGKAAKRGVKRTAKSAAKRSAALTRKAPRAKLAVATPSRGGLVVEKPSPGSGSAAQKEINLLATTTRAMRKVWLEAEKELRKLRPGATLRATSHRDDTGCYTGHLALAINVGGPGKPCC